MKRLATAALTVFLVSALTFAAFNIIPGDAASAMAGADATPEQVEQIREKLGMNRPLHTRYAGWLKGFVSGDLGDSLRFGTPVASLLREKLPVTMTLAGLSFAMILVISFPLALLTTRRENGITDRAASAVTTVSVSVPNFFLGVLIIWVFSLALKLFTAGAYVPREQSAGGFVAYLVFPALAVALPLSAMVVKFLRSAIFEQKREAYVRTAYSEGSSSGRVLSRHVLKNAVIPTVTFLGMIIGDILGGSIVVEQVFSVPGLGRLLLSAVNSRDFPLLQTLVAYVTLAVVLANTLVDIAISVIDPRIRVAA